MFNNEKDPIYLLIEIRPKAAKRKFRESIYKDWNYKCAYCGKEASSLDHIIPRFKSGPSNRNNLVPACVRCNTNKASTDMKVWYEKQPFYCPEKYARIQAWVKQELIDIYDYIRSGVDCKSA